MSWKRFRPGHNGTAEEFFWSRVEKTRGCWTWTGTRTGAGYGQMRASEGKEYAHRFSWRLHNGRIPRRHGVLHKCDNPACVRPSHLFTGTQRANMRDAAQKGRTSRTGPGENAARGEDHGFAKLTARDVKKIRKLYKPRVVTLDVLARRFNVGPITIYDIIRRKTWRHVI